MICPKCGRQLNDNTKFCTSCGAEQSREVKTGSDSDSSGRSQARNAGRDSGVAERPENSLRTDGRGNKGQPRSAGSSSGLLLAMKIIIPIALAIIAASVAIIVIHYRSQNVSGRKESVSVESEEKKKSYSKEKDDSSKRISEAEASEDNEGLDASDKSSEKAAAAIEEQDNTAVSSETEEPDNAAVPAVTEEPEKTAVPENTDSPSSDETSAVSEEPSEKEASSLTESPAEKEPDAAAEPSVTNTPDNTGEPEDRKETEDTVTPVPAPDPGLSDAVFLIPADIESEVHKEPSYDSDVMYIYDPEPHRDIGSQLVYLGEAVMGPGSDGKPHAWYKVSFNGPYLEDPANHGWVQDDTIKAAYEDNGPYYIYLDGDTMFEDKAYTAADQSLGVNVRSESKHESDLVAAPAGDTMFYFYGKIGQGYGSDGVMHDWYRVEWSDPDTGREYAGWVRSDLVVKVS